MSRLAELIADMEGYGKSGALPTRQNNPGDLRHAPGESHAANAPDAIGAFTDPAAGWAALERQLTLYASRGLTLQQAIYEFAPPAENDSRNYVNFLCDQLGCAPDTTVAAALEIPGETHER